MKKLFYIFIFILAVLFTLSSVVLAANYYNDISKIVSETSSDMSSLMGTVQQISAGNETMAAGSRKAKKYNDRALSQLVRMIDLNSETNNNSYHARIVSLISDWYLVTQLLEEGLANYDMDKINAGTQIMIIFREKASELTSEIN